MFNSLLKAGLATFMLIVMCVPAFAQDRAYDEDRTDDRAVDNSRLAWADVLRVDPVYENVVSNRPRQECHDIDAPRHSDTHGNNAAGTIIGALIGGALGNQVGKGDGRKAATVAGVVVGGAIGNNQARRDDHYYTEPQTECQTINESYSERHIVGYDVQYRYRGDVYMSQLDYDPGERMRVRISVTPAE